MTRTLWTTRPDRTSAQHDSRRPRALRPATAALVLLGLTFTGCSNPLESVINSGVEEIAEQAAEDAAGTDVEIDVDSGDGGTVELPSGFPADLPTPDGTLITSFGADDTFQLVYTVADAGAGQSLVDALVASGLTLEAESAGEELSTWILSGNGYGIAVGIATADGEEPALSYTVTPAE